MDFDCVSWFLGQIPCRFGLQAHFSVQDLMLGTTRDPGSLLAFRHINQARLEPSSHGLEAFNLFFIIELSLRMIADGLFFVSQPQSRACRWRQVSCWNPDLRPLDPYEPLNITIFIMMTCSFEVECPRHLAGERLGLRRDLWLVDHRAGQPARHAARL